MEFVLRLQKQRKCVSKKDFRRDAKLRFEEEGFRSDSEVHRKATARRKSTKVRFLIFKSRLIKKSQLFGVINNGNPPFFLID